MKGDVVDGGEVRGEVGVEIGGTNAYQSKTCLNKESRWWSV